MIIYLCISHTNFQIKPILCKIKALISWFLKQSGVWSPDYRSYIYVCDIFSWITFWLLEKYVKHCILCNLCNLSKEYLSSRNNHQQWNFPFPFIHFERTFLNPLYIELQQPILAVAKAERVAWKISHLKGIREMKQHLILLEVICYAELLPSCKNKFHLKYKLYIKSKVFFVISKSL